MTLRPVSCVTTADIELISNLTVPIGKNEVGRVEALRDAVANSSSVNDVRFDTITSFVARTFDMPFCHINLIDSNTGYIKSDKDGLSEVPQNYNRNVTFCTFTVLPESPDVLVIEETLSDPRVMFNQYVTGPPYFRFYAGAAVIVNGYKLGSLCILDTKPREFSIEERVMMLEFGALVASVMVADRDSKLRDDFNIYQTRIKHLHSTDHTVRTLSQEISNHLHATPSNSTKEFSEKTANISTNALQKLDNQLASLMSYYSSIEFMTEILMEEVRFPSMCGVNCDIAAMIGTMQQMISLFLPSSAVEWNISDEVMSAKICQTYPILLSTVMLFAGGHIAQHSSSMSVCIYIRHDIPSSHRSNEDAVGDGFEDVVGIDMAGLFDNLMIEIKGAKYVENKAVDIMSKSELAVDTPVVAAAASTSTNDSNDGVPTEPYDCSAAGEDVTTHYNELKLHRVPTVDSSNDDSMRNAAKSQDTNCLGPIRSLPVANMLDTVCGGCNANLSADTGTLTFAYWAPYCGSELSSEDSSDNTVTRAPPSMPVMKHLKTSNVLHVLIVDDDAQVRDVLSLWLADLGCVVETAETGRLGLLKLKSDVYDIIFVDFLMPVMSGVDMLQAYRDHRSELNQQQSKQQQHVGEASPRNNLDRAVFVGMLCGGEGFGLNPAEKARDAVEQGVHMFTKKPLEHYQVKAVVDRVRAHGRRSVTEPMLLDELLHEISGVNTAEKISGQKSVSSRKWFSPMTQMLERMSSRVKPM